MAIPKSQSRPIDILSHSLVTMNEKSFNWKMERRCGSPETNSHNRMAKEKIPRLVVSKVYLIDTHVLCTNFDIIES